MRQVIVISGGGTGGHLAIAKALLQECQKRTIACIYIGSTQGQDRLWFENEEGFEKTFFLQTKGVVNQKGLGIFKSAYSHFKALIQAIKILKTYQPICVFSVGGYSSAPASFASLFLGIPLFIHEQNAIKGTLNQILSPFAKAIFGSFQNTSKHFVQTSYPIQDVFFDCARERNELKRILFLGGSQGAVAINDFAIEVAPILHQKGIRIIHQTGGRDFQRVQEAYLRMQIPVDLFAFSSDLISKMAQADLCFTRSGASSIWEMCANQLPCVYVPYPYAAKNHQLFNALYFTQEDLGILCQQKDLKPLILEEILSLPLDKISKKLSAKIQKGGSREILDFILKENNG